jgi:tetratricopeptide (TPR) repeat protein
LLARQRFVLDDVLDLHEEFTSRDWATAYDISAVKEGRLIRLTLPDQNPSGAQGFFLNTRRPKLADVRVRKALDNVFDFEWTNKNIFYGLYARTESFFENSDMKAAGKPSPGELALLEATFQTDPAKPGELTLKHLAHIRSRFPQEPRVDLAKALIEENMYWRGRLQPTNGRVFIDESVTKAAITSLELAAKRPENGPEAHLRLGYLEYARDHLEDALTHLSAAALGDDDPTRLYVAYLTIGRMHEKAGRMPEAIDAFRKALAAVNGLSAALALAVRLYDINERDEADAIVEAALSLGSTARDPWKQYGYGDLRRWPAIIAKLREQAQ